MFLPTGSSAVWTSFAACPRGQPIGGAANGRKGSDQAKTPVLCLTGVRKDRPGSLCRSFTTGSW